jgi:hypothetical protein
MRPEPRLGDFLDLSLPTGGLRAEREQCAAGGSKTAVLGKLVRSDVYP